MHRAARRKDSVLKQRRSKVTAGIRFETSLDADRVLAIVLPVGRGLILVGRGGGFSELKDLPLRGVLGLGGGVGV